MTDENNNTATASGLSAACSVRCGACGGMGTTSFREPLVFFVYDCKECNGRGRIWPNSQNTKPRHL